jgi:hypothetical protein
MVKKETLKQHYRKRHEDLKKTVEMHPKVREHISEHLRVATLNRTLRGEKKERKKR